MRSTRKRARRQAGADKNPAEAADRLLALLDRGAALAGGPGRGGLVRIVAASGRSARFPSAAFDTLVRDELARWSGERRLELTDVGRARLARLSAEAIDGFTAQHADLREATILDGDGARRVTVNDGESTLAWLHRRKGPDGAPLISPTQFAAGERLRADLSRAQIMPRVTANWSAAVASGRRSADPGEATDAMIAARQQVDRALAAAGSEFAGLLIDVCGFLKRLPDIERERGWPARSAKLVLDMALTRLARHYGLETEARTPADVGLRFWRAADYRPSIDGASP